MDNFARTQWKQHQDFLFKGLDVPANLSSLGSSVKLVSPMTGLAGLNNLGISVARLDFAPYGLISPHTHPRATEVFTVLEGTIYVGFVTSNQADGSNKLFTKVLNKGDVFVFPQGHCSLSVQCWKDSCCWVFGFEQPEVQNPGVITVSNAVFGTQPPISVDVLAKAFQLDANVVKDLQSKFSNMS